ncbi:hypothetical protein ACFQ7Z_15500 [Streptomyces virginiae]|uniref:hypothetical protein n=1 Tax=Streptomyces virginiae TaxID=1961 RepID=UPI0036C9AE91
MGDTAQRTGSGAYTTPEGTDLTVSTCGNRDRASVRLDGDGEPDRGFARSAPAPSSPTGSSTPRSRSSSWSAASKDAQNLQDFTAG